MNISGFHRKRFPHLLFLITLTFVLLPLHALGAGVVVTPDSSLLIQIANFVFAIWVLNLLLYKPIRKILSQRKEKVDGLEHSIESATRDAEEKDEAFAAGIKKARSKGIDQKNALMQEATDEEKSILAGINRKAQEELEQVHDQIKQEAEVARDSLQKEIDSFADQISEKILGRAV